VDDRRKRAYRELLYHAMLDIRGIAWSGPRGWLALNPYAWRRYAHQARRAGIIADWLHNLALFSALDFERFDETWFWREYESFRIRYPDAGLERYRDRFEQQLSESG
jgi:hypothetical protein